MIKIDWMQKMASRVSNIAIPSSGYDVFGKLRERSFRNYGNHGGAIDPRKTAMPSDQYLSMRVPQLPSSDSMEDRHKRNNFNTRAEIARQSSGMASMSMAPQMNAAAAVARPGIATSRMAAGNPQVEDAGWGQTLAQMVGSGMLSQQQLQDASYSNVLSMVRVVGGTDNDRREMAFYMQRMIMEGYVRGVDLVRDIKKDYGGSMKIELMSSGNFCGGSNILGCGGMGYVQLQNNAWQNMGDGSKLALFYHEVGHEILNRGHKFVPSSLMGYDRFDNTWQKNANTYDQLMDELYTNANGVSRFNPTSGLSSADANRLIQQNPTWFPSITGADPTGIGPNGNTPPPPGGNTTNNTTIVPPTVQPANLSGTIGPKQPSGNGNQPEDASKTPVAGMLPDMPSVRSFAAGLQDTMSRASPTLQGLAGALTRFKSG